MELLAIYYISINNIVVADGKGGDQGQIRY